MAEVFDYTINYIWDGFKSVIIGLGNFLPTVVLGLLIALFFVALGWVLGNIAKKLLIEILNFAKLDEWAKEHDLRGAVGGMPLSVIAGSFLKWYVVLLFLEQALNSVQLDSLRTFMQALVTFIPILLFAMAVFVLGLLLAKFVKNKIDETNAKYKKTFGSVVELIIIYLSLVLALEKVGLNVEVLKNAFLIAFSAFVIVIALVFGISLALAFKDEAKDAVDMIKREMRDLR
ncbi:MAG: hypothetical protein AABW85_04840 [archaeon]